MPTEEEWEYACRAGATTAYFWGQDSAPAKDYGWFKDNSGDPPVPHPVGKLKPNPFGLYDIVGNVAEWCAPASPVAPHVARGGSFENDAAQLRCDARLIETPAWSELEPESPRGIWWLRGISARELPPRACRHPGPPQNVLADDAKCGVNKLPGLNFPG